MPVFKQASISHLTGQTERRSIQMFSACLSAVRLLNFFRVSVLPSTISEGVLSKTDGADFERLSFDRPLRVISYALARFL